MASKCKICQKFISAVDGVRCTKCTGLFHPVCIKLSPGHRVSGKWKCQACKGEKTESKLLAKSLSNQNLLESSDLGADKQFRRSESGETSPGELVAEVRQVIRAEMSYFREELARICTTIADFNRRADAIESRLGTLEERVSARQVQEDNRLAALEDRIAVSIVRNEKENMKEVIVNLQNQLNDREQQYFLNDVEISGLHEKNGENLPHIVSLLGKKLGVELGERDLVSVERSGPRRAVLEGETQPRPRAVCVRLARRALRDELLRAARVRRGADTSGIIDAAARRFYINEHLTRSNRQLFYKAREVARSKGWRFVWTSAGRIFIRRDTNATAHRIRCDVDLKKFFSDTSGLDLRPAEDV